MTIAIEPMEEPRGCAIRVLATTGPRDAARLFRHFTHVTHHHNDGASSSRDCDGTTEGTDNVVKSPRTRQGSVSVLSVTGTSHRPKRKDRPLERPNESAQASCPYQNPLSPTQLKNRPALRLALSKFAVCL
jgi:hypothetical protein